MKPATYLRLSFLMLTSLLIFAAPGPKAAKPQIDSQFLNGNFWDDGKAEIAFYEIWRNRNQYGQPVEQKFIAGSYLVKHDFDQQKQAKASGPGKNVAPAFKYALFYEFESRAYQYKRNWVANIRQADMMPLKQSYTCFDWCSNQYRELAFLPTGQVDHLMRSDDYGNRAGSFAYQAGSYPITALPLLMRALDFSQNRSQQFQVILQDGSRVKAEASLQGREQLKTPAGTFETEKIKLSYNAAVPSMAARSADNQEFYWRGTGPGRLLVEMKSAKDSYRVTLVEQLRSPYWQENFFPKLKNIKARP